MFFHFSHFFWTFWAPKKCSVFFFFLWWYCFSKREKGVSYGMKSWCLFSIECPSKEKVPVMAWTLETFFFFGWVSISQEILKHFSVFLGGMVPNPQKKGASYGMESLLPTFWWVSIPQKNRCQLWHGILTSSFLVGVHPTKK